MTSIHFPPPARRGKMPAMFAGHGSPMNAIVPNPFSETLAQLGLQFGASLPKPQAVLVISAHQLTRGTFISTAAKPETVHDFGGFPEALFQVQYPAKGSPETARRIQSHVEHFKIQPDAAMGMDHGAWAVLMHLFPNADVPVLQLSLDTALAPQQHFALAKALRFLRDEGVMILGSGNIVHNLRRANFASPDAPPHDWAKAFDEQVKTLLMNGDAETLARFDTLGEAAKLSVPTSEHYLPMLYVLAQQLPDDHLTFFNEAFQHAAISMRSFLLT